MAVDHLAVIESEAARIVAAYAANPGGKVPWSDRWSVNTVARHVAGSHHVVAQIIEDRPTADFGRFDSLALPAKGDPGFPGWFAAGTEALMTQCRVAPDAEACWTPHPVLGVGASRAINASPAGPAVRVACTDTAREWHLDLTEAGRTLHHEPIDVAMTLRGEAEALLLLLWGRLDADHTNVDIDGDHQILARWTELVPSM
jgi:hypothetical protein